MATKRITHEQFVQTWRSADSLQEVADTLDISPGYASVFASHLRKEGKDLKHMSKGHKPEECKRLMTRTTEAEYEAWHAAAEKAGKKLGLPNLTIGPWSRMVLNQAARALGIEIPED